MPPTAGRARTPSEVRSEPVRSCVGCRTRRAISALLRVTRVSGQIAFDGPSAGRGAWLCRAEAGVSRSCLAAAIERGGFARAWRGPVTSDEYDTIRERTAAVIDSAGAPDPDAP
jgi:predicted RNA-binding protein YlxR (DUF448 family)